MSWVLRLNDGWLARTAHPPTVEGALSRAIVALADLESRRGEEDEVPS